MIWPQLHGALTHAPLVLAIGSVAADAAARATKRGQAAKIALQFLPPSSVEPGRGQPALELRTLARWAMILAALSALPAALSGLMLTRVLTRGQVIMGGSEALRYHHLFVWPAISVVVLLGGWRLWAEGHFPRAYTAASVAAALLMAGAGYWGGEMLVGQPGAPAPDRSSPAAIAQGRKLFLQSCAHCHAADASGDEGPDLRNLQVSDRYIARMIQYGEPHEMPSFLKKHGPADIAALIHYLRSLR